MMYLYLHSMLLAVLTQNNGQTQMFSDVMSLNKALGEQ
jgi:hypothetical protein